MSFDEEQLLQTGFNAIVKAFKTKKGNTKTILIERESMISYLQSKIAQLEEETEQLKSTISILQLENQQIKQQNTKLMSSLEEKKTKLQMIKQSILDSTLAIPTIESNSTLNSRIAHKEIHKEAPVNCIPHVLKINRNGPGNGNMYQLYKKKQPEGFLTHRANSHSNTIANANTNTNTNASINNTAERINHKPKTIFNSIETKINKIKGNLSSREHAKIQIKDQSQNQSKDDDDNNSTFNIKDINAFKPKFQCSKSNSYISFKSKTTKNQIIQFRDMNSRNELMNHFLNECNSQLNPQNFEQILSLFELIKSSSLTPSDAYGKIESLLQNNVSLITLMQSIFIIDG